MKSFIKYILLGIIFTIPSSAAFAIPGYHINSNASAERGVKQFADNCNQFNAVVYQALVDKDAWRLTLAAHRFLQKKPSDPQRECSFAEAYWQSQQVGANEKVPPGDAKQLAGLFNEAVQDTKDAVAKLPDSYQAHTTYGFYLQYFVMGMQKVPEMLTQYRIAVHLRPYLGNAHFNLAEGYFGSGDSSIRRIAEMIHQYKRALQLDPRLTISNFFISASYYQEQDWKGVIIYMNRYIANNPSVATRPDIVATLKIANEKLGKK